MDSTALAQQLADYDSKRRSSADILNDAMGKYGIPEIRNRVSGLRTSLTNTENSLNAVDPSVTGRTQGSLVTEAQRTRQVANERAPIMEQYGQLSRSLDTESANERDALSAAKILAEGQVSDYNAGRDALRSRYDMAVAGEAEQRRRLESDRAYELQKQQAEAAAKASASPTFGMGAGTGVKQASMSQRGDKGFNFTDGNGRPISAATYAQLKGINFRDLLQNMAKSGDQGASAALGFVGNDYGYDPNKVTGPDLAKLYNNLVWGTGRSITGPNLGVAGNVAGRF